MPRDESDQGLKTGPDQGAGSGPPFNVCLGYQVQSPIPFFVLRGGTGAPLTVSEDGEESPDLAGELMFEWTEEDQPYARLFVNNGSYTVWVNEVGSFRIDPAEAAIAVSRLVDGPLLEARLWGLPTTLCYIHRGDYPLHSAAVEVEGSAIVLAAPGRYGKTTLASAFLGAGARVLSEDLTCCRVDPAPSILPGPALLRVRRDVYDRLEFPSTRVEAEDLDRFYLTIDESARGDGSPVPLRAIVLLRKSEEPPRMERVPVERALPDIWHLSFTLPTDADRARAFRGVTALASRVPVWDFHRRLSFDNLPELVDIIVSTCLA